MTPWSLICQGYFPTACIWRIANMSPARLLGRSARPICPLITAVRLLLPCAPCVPSLREFVPATLWLRSPLERGHILFPARANLHGWHVGHGIVYQFGRVHIALVAEARSDLLLPSDPCSLPHFRYGFGPIIRLQLRLEPLLLPSATNRPGWRYSPARYPRVERHTCPS